MGYNQSGNASTSHKKEMDENVPIKFDKNCISCSNQYQPLIKSAFKMACLVYKPQPIQFDG